MSTRRRRHEWEYSQEPKGEDQNKKALRHQQGPERSTARIVKKKPAIQRMPGTTTLRELEKVHPAAGPAKFLVVARVVDYHPENIEDFVSLYCSSCDRE